MHRFSMTATVLSMGLLGAGAAPAPAATYHVVRTVEPTAPTAKQVEEYAALIAVAYDAACAAKRQEATEALAKTAPELRGWEYHHIQLLISGSDSPYATAPGKVQIGPPDFKAGLCVSPTGHRVAMGGVGGKARIFDLATREEITSWEVLPPAADPANAESEKASFVREVIFVGDGSSVLTVAPPRSVAIWDVATHAKRLTLEPECEGVSNVAVNRDGTRVLIAGPGAAINAFDATTGAKVASFGKGMNFGLPLGFTPDGTRMVTGGMATLTLWDMTGKEAGTLGQTSPYLMAFAFNPEGSLLAVGTRGSIAKCVRVFDVASKEMLWDFSAHGKGVNNVCFSPDGTRLISSGAQVGLKIWEPRTGTLVLEIPVGEPFGAAAFSADGTYIAWACKSGVFSVSSLPPAAK